MPSGPDPGAFDDTQPIQVARPVPVPSPASPEAPPAASAAPSVDLTPPRGARSADPAPGRPTVMMTAYGELPAYNADDVLPTAPPGKEPRAPRVRKGSGDGDDSGRRRAGPTPLGRAVLPLALALVSAVALVAAWTHLQDDRATGSAAPVVSPPAASSPAASGGTAASQTPIASESPSAAASESPSAVASAPAPVTSGVSSRSSAPSASASSTALPVDRSVPVVVLNSTARTGLAAKVASALRADGWKVVSIGNYRGGRLALTTVFAEGNAAAVATMRDDLPGSQQVKAPVGSMSAKRLTVVIGADYPRR